MTITITLRNDDDDDDNEGKPLSDSPEGKGINENGKERPKRLGAILP